MNLYLQAMYLLIFRTSRVSNVISSVQTVASLFGFSILIVFSGLVFVRRASRSDSKSGNFQTKLKSNLNINLVSITSDSKFIIFILSKIPQIVPAIKETTYQCNSTEWIVLRKWNLPCPRNLQKINEWNWPQLRYFSWDTHYISNFVELPNLLSKSTF